MKRTVAKELGAQVVVRTSEAVIRNALDICVNPDARWFSSACALSMFFIHYDHAKCKSSVIKASISELL